MFACKEENVKFWHFEFIKLVTQMKIPLKKRENELLQDTLGLMAAELKDGSQEINDCTKHVQMQ